MGLRSKAKEYVQEKIDKKIEELPKPEATLSGLSLLGVGMNGVSYKAIIDVMNPYPHRIPLCDVAYVLKSDGRVVLSGNMPDNGDLEGKHTITKVEVGILMPHGAIVSLVRDIVVDWDIDYVLEVILTVDIPVIGSFNIPLCYQGEVKLPTIADFWKGSEEDDNKNKGKNKEKDKKDKDTDKDDKKVKDKKKDKTKGKSTDEEEGEKGGIHIPIISNLLGRGGSDDEKDKGKKDKETDKDKSKKHKDNDKDKDKNNKDNDKNKDKKDDKDKNENGGFNIPIISNLLDGSDNSDNIEKDKNKCKNIPKDKDKKKDKDQDD